ncbi:hypothetical protein APHAL10511_008155 [Amanita phalloides]|nr:hypothetical protein APHAL10511_008155 [Amanita phalloides]
MGKYFKTPLFGGIIYEFGTPTLCRSQSFGEVAVKSGYFAAHRHHRVSLSWVSSGKSLFLRRTRYRSRRHVIVIEDSHSSALGRSGVVEEAAGVVLDIPACLASGEHTDTLLASSFVDLAIFPQLNQHNHAGVVGDIVFYDSRTIALGAFGMRATPTESMQWPDAIKIRCLHIKALLCAISLYWDLRLWDSILMNLATKLCRD